MRILLLHNFYQKAGGEDVVFKTETALLKEKGHEVEHLTFDNKDIKDSLTGKLLTGVRSIYNSQSYRRLAKKIEEFKPDVIHVHNFFPLASPSIFYAAQKKQTPIVMTLHNFRLICPSAILFYNNEIYEKSIHKTFPWDAIRKGVYRDSKLQTASVGFTTGIHKLLGTWRNKVDRYITFTEFGRQKFLDSSLGLKESQIAIKPNFVLDLGKGKTQREDFFVFIGRLTEEKGVRVILEAAKQGKFALKILGDGPLRSEVENYAQENNNIEYLGFKDKAFIAEQLQTCRALLFPSLWYEGMPMTILETYSTGTPIIASNMGAPSVMVDHGYNGLLFEPGQVQDLLSQVENLLSDEDRYQQMLQNARTTYEEKFTPQKNYEILLNIYEEVIAEKKGSKNTALVS